METEAEVQAWGEYLTETQPLQGIHYEQVETWAWAKLGKKLLELERERQQELTAA